jgi:predicted ATPase
MKEIKRFQAKGIYGYIDIDLRFYKELTFLYGLNGSGKTTALKLMMALLEPSLAPLLSIPFETAEVQGEDHELGEVSIKATKHGDILTISCTASLDGDFSLSTANLTHEEAIGAFSIKFKQHPVNKTISKIYSPIFLGIDRRFRTPSIRQRFRPARSPQLAIEFEREKTLQDSRIDSGLSEVEFIVEEFMRSVRRRQSSADDKFRRAVLLDAFSYITPAPGITLEPDPAIFRELSSKSEAIIQAFARLNLEEEVKIKSYEFFAKLEEVASRIQRLMVERKAGNKDEEELTSAFMTWFVNQPQLDRIDRLFRAATTYKEELDKLTRPFDAFINITNKFFQQTGKSIVAIAGEIRIDVGGKKRTIGCLSSGERQMLIILAHLSLNSRLKKDGVFVVDEPELSLHMAWQDMFVDAIQSANPKLQLILATHSPAIIAGRDGLCIPVGKE